MLDVRSPTTSPAAADLLLLLLLSMQPTQPASFKPVWRLRHDASSACSVVHRQP